jgi:hypothetical protein
MCALRAPGEADIGGSNPPGATNSQEDVRDVAKLGTFGAKGAHHRNSMRPFGAKRAELRAPR